MMNQESLEEKRARVLAKLQRNSDVWRESEYLREDMLSLEDAAAFAQTTPLELEWRRENQEVLALALERQPELRYPRWQFEPELVDRNIRKLIQGVLSVEPPWTVYRFMITPTDRLNNLSPIEALRQNKIRYVADYVECLLEDQTAL